MKRSTTYLLLMVFFSAPNILLAYQNTLNEPEKDTAKVNPYILNLKDHLILRPFMVYKANGIEVSGNNKAMRYRPSGTMSIGIGFNYKWLGLGISVGFPATSAQSEKYGNTKRIDLQFGVYSKAIGADLHYQEYKGYYLANPGDFTYWDRDYLPQLPGMRVLTYGANLFYIFNNKKFSYRAAYIGNQVQKKSAGSAVTGLFFVQDEVLTDDGFIPSEIYDSTYANYDLKSFYAWTLGVTAGYTYTFVIGKKGFFINAAGIPGFGYRNYTLEDLSGNQDVEKLLALHLNIRAAIGYTRSKFVLNLMGTINIRNYEYKSYQLGISTEQVRLTFGWRFETKSSKRKGQLYE